MDAAKSCLDASKNEFYAGKQIKARFVQRNALKTGTCKKYSKKERCCDDCNFIHYFRPGEIV